MLYKLLNHLYYTSNMIEKCQGFSLMMFEKPLKIPSYTQRTTIITNIKEFSITMLHQPTTFLTMLSSSTAWPKICYKIFLKDEA